MLLHVGRDGAGRRRLCEIAVLDQGGAGRVRATTVWHADRGLIADAAPLGWLSNTREST